MELKNWQKLHLGAELRTIKEYLSAINYCICFLIGFSAFNIFERIMYHPNSRYINWITVFFSAFLTWLVHYQIEKLINYILSVLEAYNSYQMNWDEFENRNNFKP